MRNPVTELEQLSIWEVAHRWVGVDPDSTDPNNLPLDVRDRLRAIVIAIGGTLNVYDREGNETAYHPSDLPLIARLLGEGKAHSELGAARQDRVYRKEVLDRLYLLRDEVAMWCLRSGIQLPPFWLQDWDRASWERIRPDYGPSLAEIEAKERGPLSSDKAEKAESSEPTLTEADLSAAHRESATKSSARSARTRKPPQAQFHSVPVGG